MWEYRCGNTGVGVQVWKHSLEAQVWEHRCGSTGVGAQVWKHRCGSTGVKAQVWKHRCGAQVWAHLFAISGPEKKKDKDPWASQTSPVGHLQVLMRDPTFKSKKDGS